MPFDKIVVPSQGEKITLHDDKLHVPDQPIICFIEGDGTGVDIWAASRPVLDAAVEKAYGGKRKIAWMEVYAGDKANEVYGETIWLPQETVDAIDEYIVAIKGPLTTPIGGGIRSINVALRQRLDLYACVRPVQYFTGVPSPVRHPELVDMVIFRENTEDIYAGIEWEAYSEGAQKVVAFLQTEMGVKKIRFPASSGIGIKPVSEEGTARLVRAAITYAIENSRKSVTLVHKGNIMKFTEGAFMQWGYKIAQEEFGGDPVGRRSLAGAPQWYRDQGHDCRRHAAADPDPTGRVRHSGHPQPERRLHQRRAGRTGGRHRHRSRRQHQLRHRAGGLRGHARHCA